jgi:hypothetical protein
MDVTGGWRKASGSAPDVSGLESHHRINAIHAPKAVAAAPRAETRRRAAAAAAAAPFYRKREGISGARGLASRECRERDELSLRIVAAGRPLVGVETLRAAQSDPPALIVASPHRRINSGDGGSCFARPNVRFAPDRWENGGWESERRAAGRQRRAATRHTAQ